MNEDGVEYAARPGGWGAEARCNPSAAAGLAAFLGCTVGRALELLDNPEEYVATIRARRRLSGEEAAGQLRRRWRPGYPDPYGG